MKGEVQGVRRVLQALEVEGRRAPKDIEDLLIAAGLIVLKKAKYYCPKDTHDLVNSGRLVTYPGNDLKGPEIQIVFGDDLVVNTGIHYTIYVHEDLTKYHEPPTSAKFLERAYRETRGEQNQIIQKKFKETFGLLTKKHNVSPYQESTEAFHYEFTQ